MLSEVNIPKVGMHMMEAELTEWLVADGALCQAGDPIANIETDKVEQEIYAPANGYLRIVAEVGEIAPVGAVIGLIADDAGELPEPGNHSA
jgi:pyruvate/2-oxoglutarate dehydrogenase complex dihydrolipoamide acyltransferase (E2) component